MLAAALKRKAVEIQNFHCARISASARVQSRTKETSNRVALISRQLARENLHLFKQVRTCCPAFCIERDHKSPVESEIIMRDGNTGLPDVLQMQLAMRDLLETEQHTLMALLSGFRLIQQEVADIAVEVVAIRKALVEADPSFSRRYGRSASAADQDPLLVDLRRSIRELEDALAGIS
jgi:hypothetical protein